LLPAIGRLWLETWRKGMKNFLVILIILLSGLLIAQLLMVDKHDSAVRQAAVQHETLPADTSSASPQDSTAARGTAHGKVDDVSAGKTLAGIDRRRMTSPDQARESNDSVSEYNISHVQVYDTGEAANSADESSRTQESNVSQAQIDFVKKREAARQRRDQLLKMRAETIRTLNEEEGLDQQSAQ
jgi:hypothetical protein